MSTETVVVRKVFPSGGRLPLSGAVQVGSTLYVSGQLGVDPTSKQLVEGGIEAETRQTLENISNTLKSAGSSLHNVVKTTVLLADIQDFAAMNKVYQEYFQEGRYPARAAFQVAKLPIPGAKVEIESIAIVGEVVEAKL